MKIYRPPKLCECGCGQPTQRIGKTSICQNRIKGEYNRFVWGHNKNRKGVKLSKELCEKWSLIRQGQVPWNLGLTMSDGYCLNVSIGYMGQIAWNTGLTKETDERVLKLANKLMGKKRSEEVNQTRALLQKELWQDPEYRQRQLLAIGKGLCLLPNKPEAFLMGLLDTLYPGEWKYTGDYSFLIGGKNPDFVNINGQKKCIEHYGDWWHKNDNPQDRIDLFKSYGWDCLVIWGKELTDFKSLIRKIFNFTEDKKY